MLWRLVDIIIFFTLLDKQLALTSTCKSTKLFQTHFNFCGNKLFGGQL